MQTIIKPAVPAVIECRCDGCNELVSSSLEDLHSKEICLAIEAAFGYFSPADGYNYKVALCGDCAMKLTEAMEKLFNIKIYPGFGMGPFFNEDESNESSECERE